MSAVKLKEYLDSHGVKYEMISHPREYTAQQVAAVTHISGREMAKSVIVKIKGKMAMAVLPASCRVDFTLLREVIGMDDIELAREHEFKDIFDDCEIGAMPPFGNLYDLDVYVAEKLTEDKIIAFNAGTHTEIIKMAFADYERLVKPKIFRFAAG
jgi:Ala-tRNA(Pro) deacylase